MHVNMAVQAPDRAQHLHTFPVQMSFCLARDMREQTTSVYKHVRRWVRMEGSYLMMGMQ